MQEEYADKCQVCHEELPARVCLLPDHVPYPYKRSPQAYMVETYCPDAWEQMVNDGYEQSREQKQAKCLGSR